MNWLAICILYHVNTKVAIKSHLTSLLSIRSHHTILISVYCKNCENTITLFLWLDTKSPCLQACYGHISPVVQGYHGDRPRTVV